eukprot:Pompholyxophrys_punicea_v1_NODE_1204_length_868_cov_14.371614.p3 type:complete len:106 gc:universal NODE_1204_length_868_cov_14.371614:544-861(+)
MIEYFESRGIVVVFLPAYCPFFHPIELVFGYVKRRCRALYHQPGTELEILQLVLAEFSFWSARKIFRYCGYSPSGCFDPNVNFDFLRNVAKLPKFYSGLTLKCPN